jgi:hypothetical protein
MLAIMVMAPASVVTQFVGEHAFEFFVREQCENAVGDCDRGVRGIASGGEGVGRFGGDDVHLRHGDADFLGQAFDGSEGARQLLASDRLGAIHGQRDLVGVEV